MPSLLEQYRIADFLDWHREHRLELNPNFQRGSVWTPAARTYLIDTILRQLPVPKVFLRTHLDAVSKKAIREVVDGQQRLRAILDFAEDKFVLSRRAGEYQGKRYSDLGTDLQERFLGYAIAVDQLLNASDDDVLEVFARLNSYSVALNPPEKRHARYQGEFKWAIRAASARWSVLWDRYQLVRVRDRVRMLDDSLTAEMFGILLEGVRDGGQTKIDALYKRHDRSWSGDTETQLKLDQVLGIITQRLADGLQDTPVLRAPHFLMLFAAVAHALIGIVPGDLPSLPPRDERSLSAESATIDNLRLLGSIIDSAEAPEGYEEFWRASRGSTQRIASRRVRFPLYFRALDPEPL